MISNATIQIYQTMLCGAMNGINGSGLFREIPLRKRKEAHNHDLDTGRSAFHLQSAGCQNPARTKSIVFCMSMSCNCSVFYPTFFIFDPKRLTLCPSFLYSCILSISTNDILRFPNCSARKYPPEHSAPADILLFLIFALTRLHCVVIVPVVRAIRTGFCRRSHLPAQDIRPRAYRSALVQQLMYLLMGIQKL